MHCVHTQGRWIGKPFRLFPWQKKVILELFEVGPDKLRRYRWALIGVPKKQGKTELAAALALYFLIGDDEPSPWVACAAGSDGQADLVFGAAKKMCELSPTLALITECFEKEILVPSIPGAKLARVAAAAGTNDGPSWHAVICDELHEWTGKKGRDVWNVLTNSGGAREQPMILQITTAGYDEETVCYEQYAHCKKIVSGETKDPRYYFYWLEPPEKADHRKLAVWKKVNPSFGVTVPKAFYEDQLLKKPENVFRRYFLNEWTSNEEGWISSEEWDACEGKPDLSKAEEEFGGVDIGQVHDSSAVMRVGWVGDKLHIDCRIWTPQPNKPITVGEVEAHVVNTAEENEVAEIAYDPARFNRSAEILEERGIVMVEFPQTDLRMNQASNTLLELVREERIVHNGDPLLRAHVLAGVASETDRGWRISKKKSGKKKIDALVALAMAAQRAVASQGRARPGVEVLA